MLSYLYPHVDWGAVEAVGFDLDGTLYDEFEFVFQAYGGVAEVLASRCGESAATLFDELCARWLHKGSSYPRIFEEVALRHRVADIQESALQCVEAYRNCLPSLALSRRVQTVLAHLHARHALFLITDGQPSTQRRKLEALGLERFIPAERVVITGQYGGQCVKPGIESILRLDMPVLRERPGAVVYFGDRERDAQFARAAGFQFARVRVMVSTEAVE